MTKYVTVNKIKTQIMYNETHKMNSLNLSRQDISKISQIKGLHDFKSLSLDLSFNEITEIEDLEKLKNLISLRLNYNKFTGIKGLEKLKNLISLYLGNNEITEIKGFENLKNLVFLDLNNNQITEIKGLESLDKLKYLRIGKNNISKKLIQQLGGLDIEGFANNPQKFIGYCKEEE